MIHMFGTTRFLDSEFPKPDHHRAAQQDEICDAKGYMLMAQPTSIQIDRLTVISFGYFADGHSRTFGSMTTGTGHNYQGNSTIADVVTYALADAPFFGGRDYVRLSLSERMRCGLEVVELLAG